jgi:hypothetical protein
VYIMQIAAIGSTLPYNGLKSSEDSEINALEKNKGRLQEQIEKVKESNLDAKSKQDRIKVLQDQIQQIDATIQQKKLDKMRPKEVTAPVSSEDPSPTANGQFTADRTLLQLSSSYDQMRTMHSIKNTLKGEARVLASEIALDQSRGGSAAAVDKKREKLEDLKEKQSDLNRKIAEKNSEMNERINDWASEQNQSEKADNEEAAFEADKNNTDNQNQTPVKHPQNKTVSKNIDLYL